VGRGGEGGIEIISQTPHLSHHHHLNNRKNTLLLSIIR
jgi:hypothetical protein